MMGVEAQVPTIIRLTDNSFDQDVPRFAERMVQDTVEYPAVGALLYQLLADDGVRRDGNSSELIFRIGAIAMDTPGWSRQAVHLCRDRERGLEKQQQKDHNKMGNQISAFNATEEKLWIFPPQCVNTDIGDAVALRRLEVSHVKIVAENLVQRGRSVIYQFRIPMIGLLLSRLVMVWHEISEQEIWSYHVSQCRV